MCFHLSFRQHCLIVIVVSIELSGNQFVIAVETLPVLTVTAPEESLDYRVNNPQLLDEDYITVAHERTITDVIQGFPGVTSGKVSTFGNGALYPRGRRARRSYPGGHTVNSILTGLIESG